MSISVLGEPESRKAQRKNILTDASSRLTVYCSTVVLVEDVACSTACMYGMLRQSECFLYALYRHLLIRPYMMLPRGDPCAFTTDGCGHDGRVSAVGSQAKPRQAGLRPAQPTAIHLHSPRNPVNCTCPL